MVSDNTAKPPTFNWTEEEKALLQRTLRIKALEEDRIEIETLEPRQVRSLATTLTFVVPALAIAALVVAFGTSVSPQGLLVPIWMLAAAPLIGLLMLLGGPRGPVNPSEPVTLFPATPWCVRHRQPQSCLEILQRTPLDTSMSDWRTLPLDTDVGPLLLRVAHRTPIAVRLELRQLILDRCVRVATAPEPPAQVVSLVGVEVVRLPRAFYVPLQRYLDVVSVTAETLTVCGWPGRSLPTALVLLVELLLLFILPIFLPALGAWPDNIAVGTAQSAWVWRLVLFGALTSLGPIHSVIDDWQARRSRKSSLTLSKEATFIVVREHRGELQIPTKACMLLCEVTSDSDMPVETTTIRLQHGKNLLAMWDLQPPPSLEEHRALERELHQYLRSGSLRRESTGSAVEDEE